MILVTSYAVRSSHLMSACLAWTQGLPVVSLQWGPWGGTGMAADDALQRQLEAAGAPPLPPADGLAALAAAMSAVQQASDAALSSQVHDQH
jgi:hypothetical protein